MKIVHSQFELCINSGASAYHDDRKPLDKSNLDELKRTLLGCIIGRSSLWREVKQDSSGLVVVDFRKKRWLSPDQALELQETLEAKGVNLEVVSPKELVLFTKRGTIKVILACGSSNFPAALEPKRTRRMTRAERAEARARAKAAMTPSKQAPVAGLVAV